MFEITNSRVNVSIKLDNGLYLFDPISATGKTRLFKYFQDLQTIGKPVACYGYQDKVKGLDIENVLVPNKYKVIIIDRFDLYCCDISDLINRCRDNTIILVDSKLGLGINDSKICYIEMKEDYIEVYK